MAVASIWAVSLYGTRGQLCIFSFSRVRPVGLDVFHGSAGIEAHREPSHIRALGLCQRARGQEGARAERLRRLYHFILLRSWKLNRGLRSKVMSSKKKTTIQPTRTNPSDVAIVKACALTCPLSRPIARA